MIVATHYLQHIPKVEQMLAALRPDAIVCGMGPTAWLLPWIDQSLLSGVRLFGAHDGCSIMPMDDLMLMDGPKNELHPGSIRHQRIVESRPKRLWIYEKIVAHWDAFLAPATKSIRTSVQLAVWHPQRTPPNSKFKLEKDPIQTVAISPTGTTTLAWQQGCRRIAVIGVEMRKGEHKTCVYGRLVDGFFCAIAQQAKELGGAIWNVSPITALEGFAKWTNCEFSSAQANHPSSPVVSV